MAVALLGVSAAARATPCAPVVRGVGLDEEWRRAADVFSDELAGRFDVDRCVVITIRKDGGRATVIVTAGDRRASRTVTDPADLRSTLLALLLEPVPAPDAEVKPRTRGNGNAAHPDQRRGAAAEPGPAPATTPGSRLSLPGAPLDAPAPSTDGPLAGADVRARVQRRERGAAQARIQLGAAVGALWTGDAAHAAPTALISWIRGPWLVGLDGRLDLGWAMTAQRRSAPVSATTSDVPEAASSYRLRSREIGAEVGHRFELASIAMTTSGGSSLLSIEQTREQDAATSRSIGVVRVGGRVRAEAALSRRFDVFVLIDASFDVGRFSQAGNAMTEAPPLPTWSAGIAFGGQVRAWP